MPPPRRACCCLFVHGDVPESFADRLENLLAHTPPEAVELRLGFRAATHSLHYALGRLCPDGATPARQLLPDGVERFAWTAAAAMPVRAWHAPAGQSPEALARLVYHDVPLETEYAIALENGVEAGWWEALARRLDEGADYLGEPHWQDYTPAQVERLQGHPCYLGVPFARRDGRPGVSFLAGGLVAVRSERLRESRFPDPRFAAADGPGALRPEVLLGEIANQLGWRQAPLAEPESRNGTAAP